MQSNIVNLMLMRWLWPIALTLLASCGGDNDSTLNTFVATLDGTQESSPNASTAKGNGTATFDTATKVLTATVTTSGMVGSAAHIHNGAPGISGPIIFPLTETPAGSGRWSTTVTLTDPQSSLLMAGNYYFNVHSVTFPNGEIRGQILQPPVQMQPVNSGRN